MNARPNPSGPGAKAAVQTNKRAVRDSLGIANSPSTARCLQGVSTPPPLAFALHVTAQITAVPPP